MSIAALVVLGFIGAHAAWGRDASSASAGDCVYHRHHAWHLDPCALPLPWHDTTNYKVIQRLEGPSTHCNADSDRPTTIDRAVLTEYPQVTLCLAPLP